jgi:hypothetical protein
MGSKQTLAGFLVPAFDCGKGAAAGFLPLGGYHRERRSANLVHQEMRSSLTLKRP